MSGGDHSFGLNVTSVQTNVSGAALDVPATVREATVPPVRVESQELADGVWYLRGSSHNSVAVEFRDFRGRRRGPPERGTVPGDY